MATFYGRGGSSYANTPEVEDGSAVRITSAGPGTSLIVDGTGPALTLKGVAAGAGITLSEVANDIVVTNANGAFSARPWAQVVNATFTGAIVGAPTVVPVVATSWNRGGMTITATSIDQALAGLWTYRIEVHIIAVTAGVTGLIIRPNLNGAPSRRFRLPVVAGETISGVFSYESITAANALANTVTIESEGANHVGNIQVFWSSRWHGV